MYLSCCSYFSIKHVFLALSKFSIVTSSVPQYILHPHPLRLRGTLFIGTYYGSPVTEQSHHLLHRLSILVSVIQIKQDPTEIDLSPVCGPHSSPIHLTHYQQNPFPDQSYFRYPKCYHGENSLEAVTFMIKESLPGATFMRLEEKIRSTITMSFNALIL